MENQPDIYFVCVWVCVFVSVDSPKFVWYCHSYATHVLCAIASANAGEGDLRLHCWGGWWVRLQGRRNYWGPRLQWLFLVQGTFVRQSGPVSSQLHIPSWRDQMRVLSDEHLTMSRLPSVPLTTKKTHTNLCIQTWRLLPCICYWKIDVYVNSRFYS